MKTLVVDDDFASRLTLQKLLARYGEVHTAVSGSEAMSAFEAALNENEPYELICLDVMMPVMDGQEVLRKIRASETERGISNEKRVKIFMATALSDKQYVLHAGTLCDAYLIKPIRHGPLLDKLRSLGLIK